MLVPCLVLIAGAESQLVESCFANRGKQVQDVRVYVSLSVLIALMFVAGAIVTAVICGLLIALSVDLFGGTIDMDAPLMWALYVFGGLISVAHGIVNGSFVRVLPD